HGYDASGGVSSYRDPIGDTSEVTETITDRIGRPRQRTYADKTTETYEYDGPRLHSMKDRQNRIYTYIYKEGTGQLSELRIGTAVVEQFDYDAAGRLNKWRTRDAELQFDNFDDEGRPRVTRQIRFVNRSGFENPQVLNTLVQEHEWNVHGERKSWTMPAFEGMNAAGWTKSVAETHDAAGNVETITRTLYGEAAPSVLLTSTYRNSGRPDVRTLTTATGASIVRKYGYDPSTAMLNDMTVAGKGGVVVGGSRITYDGVQIAKAVLHGVSAEARANEYDYDDRSRLLTSSAAREQGSVPSAEVVDNSDFRHKLVRPGDDAAALPSLDFAHAPGHKIAQLTRGDVTRTFSYGNGAERIDDDRYEYEFDARGRLITATQKAVNTASPRRRFHYYYSAADRVVGRRAEYWSTSATEGWKLDDRSDILAADALPADATFAWDPISDRIAAVFGPNNELVRQFIHGGNAYDDPLEVAIAEGSMVGRLYPIFDESGAGTLQVILNTNAEVISRTVMEGAYGEDETTLAGPAVDQIAAKAKRDSSGAIESVDITIRITEAIAPATVATGARLATIAANGTVVRTTPVTPTLLNPHTLRWTLTAAEWQSLLQNPTGEAKALSIAITNTLRPAAWSADAPILPPPTDTPAVYTSAELPVEYRQPLDTLDVRLASAEPLFTARALSALAGTTTPASRLLMVAGFQALPFQEQATGLVFARARWYDPATGAFVSPDPLGYVDSSNLYAFAGGDPVNRRDPTGLRAPLPAKSPTSVTPPVASPAKDLARAARWYDVGRLLRSGNPYGAAVQAGLAIQDAINVHAQEIEDDADEYVRGAEILQRNIRNKTRMRHGTRPGASGSWGANEPHIPLLPGVTGFGQQIQLADGVVVDQLAQYHNLEQSLRTSPAERRRSPGSVVGGEELPIIGGDWLRGSHGNAGRIPRQVAEKLRGRTFASFDEFRREFWMTVGNDPTLSAQFSKENVAAMKKGLAPVAVKSQQLGEQRSYILHHVTPIQQGGGVYDLNNLVVVTPRYHKEILSADYHY
ncbi:MAG TPA: RHS repeat-associated core domain-containing protein, partial [Thermoanaerobaculia bacterium]